MAIPGCRNDYLIKAGADPVMQFQQGEIMEDILVIAIIAIVVGLLMPGWDK